MVLLNVVQMVNSTNKALRFTLLNYTSTGRDINLDVQRIEGYRKFCNKLWNATKFALMKLGDDFVPLPLSEFEKLEKSLPEEWILSRLNTTSKEINTLLQEMSFMAATNSVYSFWLYDLCDVYIEVSKYLIESENTSKSAKNTLYICLEQGLKLLHPMMPFVTEELYQRLPKRHEVSDLSISTTRFPQFSESWSFNSEYDFTMIIAIVASCRSLLVDYGVKGATIYVQVEDKKLFELITSQKLVIKNLVKGLSNIEVVGKESDPAGCALSSVTKDCNVFLLVKGVVDFEIEIQKFTAKLTKAMDSKTALEQKMGVSDYQVKVKLEVQKLNLEKISVLENEIESLERTIENFKKLAI